MRYKIFKDGEAVNTIVADEDFCKKYCAENDYTYELMTGPETIKPEPTEMERIRADVDFIAMEMGVEL